MTTINLTPEQEAYLRKFQGATEQTKIHTFLARLADQLPRPIRVGDRVRIKGADPDNTCANGTVAAIVEECAFVAYYAGRPGSVHISDLERA